MSERVMTQLSEAYPRSETHFASRSATCLISIRHAMPCPNDQLEEMDRWMLERAAELVTKCREWYTVTIFIASITPFTISV